MLLRGVQKAARFAGVFLLAGLIVLGTVANAATDDRTLFIGSAVENADGTVTLPLYRGTSRGRTVWFIVVDASEGQHAERLRVNRAPKLANARGTLAVQKVSVLGGIVDFPATVDFAPERQVVGGPLGFPPLVAAPGAVGEPGYSPLIELPEGTILNAPHVANDSGRADEVVLQGGRARHAGSTSAISTAWLDERRASSHRACAPDEFRPRCSDEGHR